MHPLMSSPEDFLAALSRGRHQRGRIVDLRHWEGSVILVGDLHAKPERLDWLLSRVDLETQRVVLLGDLFHREEVERAGEMDSSLHMLRRLMHWKVRYPDALYALLGNHEFTRNNRQKHGYCQGALFRRALEAEGLGELYDRFIEASPLVALHPQAVAVHAAPSSRVNSLEELAALPVVDVPMSQWHPAVLELTCFRHRNWSPSQEKSYSDYDVHDFLELCGCPEATLITGHTPLQRECDWRWQMGPRNWVIFAAGRELGWVRLEPDRLEFRRLGRSQRDADEEIVPDRADSSQQRLLLEDAGPYELLPDRTYELEYPGWPIGLRGQGWELRLCHYRHLDAGSQLYYGGGYYLVGQSRLQEVIHLKRHQALLVGGRSLHQGVRLTAAALHEQEWLVLSQGEEGHFSLRALRPGVQLRVC